MMCLVISGSKRRHGTCGQQWSNGQGADDLRACAEVLPEPRTAGADRPITDVHRGRGRALDHNSPRHLERTSQTVHAPSCLPGLDCILFEAFTILLVISEARSRATFFLGGGQIWEDSTAAIQASRGFAYIFY